MAYRKDWIDYIRANAAKYGLDPAAVLAVAATEGLSGGVGDGGHAFGPFQLNDAGGVITGRPGNHRAFAESTAGIDYALKQMGGIAKGLKGRAAIVNIVRRFERPANKEAGIANALSYYGTVGGGTLPPPENSPLPPGAIPSVRATTGADTRALALQGLQTLASGGHYDALWELSKLAQAKRAAAQVPPPPIAQPQEPQVAGVGGDTNALASGDWSEWVVQGPGMDRAGLVTRPGVLQFVSRVAQIVESPLTIGTGTNHNEFVKGTNRQSDHWFGSAADIPATGKNLLRIGQASLIAAGMPPAEARKQTGGVYNVGGYNILFNTNVGGNHYNHLHVGMGRILGRD